MAHTASPAAGRAGQVVKGLLALVVLAGVLIALPAVLYWAAGNPLPHHLPTPAELWALATTRDDGQLFVHALAIVAWVAFGLFAWAWLGLLISVIVEFPAQLRRRRTIRIPGFGVQQRIAAGLVAAVIGIVASPTLGIAALTANHAAPAVASVVQDQIADIHGPAAGTRPVVSFINHPVTRGESLLGVAEHYGVQVSAVAEANYGITQPDGRSLQRGNTRIYAGWTIRVPTSSAEGVPVVSRIAAHRAPLSTVAPVYQVRGGDWLWYIAQRFLGDPERYTDIAALNPGLEAGDHRFPDHIEAPWHIRLPADAVDRGPRQHATGAIVGGAPAAAAPTHADPQPPGDTPPGATGGQAAGATPATPPPGSPAATIPATPSAPTTTPTAVATPTAVSAPNGRIPSVAHPPQSAPAGAAERPSHDSAAGDDGEVVYGSLAGAGLLAALLLAALYRRRRRQQQHRQPGQRLPHPRGGGTERSLRIAEQPADVDMLDHALRSLAAALADRDQTQLPDIVGSWIVERTIHLILAAPCSDPPPPWTAHGTQWTLDGDADIPQVADQLAPLPTLVAVGSQPGRHLLLDLERLGALSIAGDPDRAVALLRYLAGELACNSWSDDVEITIARFPIAETELLVALNPDRIRAVSSVPEAAARLRRRASAVTAALGQAGAGDALAGRVGDYAEAWAPQVLLVAEPDEHDLAALTDLGQQLAGVGRCAVAVATTARHGQPATGHVVAITAAGELHVELPFLRTSAASAALPVDELEPLAEIMRQARVASAEPTPAAPEPEPWAADTDAAGALLTLYAQDGPTQRTRTASLELSPSPATPPEEPAEDPMAAPAARGAVAAVTTAPRREISAAIRQRRLQADPHLDDDLSAWRNQDPRPRIGILGPVAVEAAGDEPAQRRRFHAEIIVYLAQRGARGATADHLTDALWPDQVVKDASRRVAITRARRWLGTTPAGGAWLPEMAADRVYRLEPGYLLDWHLFRRLRSRGEAHGTDGVDDLRAALDLVRGVPLEGADRPHAAGARNPYTWLPESDIYPGHITSAIVDTAHELAELYLNAGDAAGARWTVHQAWLADPYRGDDEPWHDLMRAAHTDRHTAELRSLFGELMAAREAEVPEDLNRATYAWLRALLPDLLGASTTPPPTVVPSAWPTEVVG